MNRGGTLPYPSVPASVGILGEKQEDNVQKNELGIEKMHVYRFMSIDY
jgi:hypothetical protein